MRLRHLGTESNKTGCPALYATDRRTLVVQGWKVRNPRELADLVEVRDDDIYVEIPKGLLRHDDRDAGQIADDSRPGGLPCTRPAGTPTWSVAGRSPTRTPSVT
jgi:hypothetical protein